MKCQSRASRKGGAAFSCYKLKLQSCNADGTGRYITLLSLKAFMDHSALGMGEALRRSVLVLLETVELNAFSCGTDELASFQRRIETLRHGFDKAHSTDELLDLTGQAVRRIEEYGAATDVFVSKQRRQTRETITLLMHSLMEISKGSKDSVRNLERIGGDLEKLYSGVEIASVNERLRVCLDALEHESKRQQQLQSGIDRQLTRVATLETGVADTDAATGLAGVQSATQAIRASATNSGTSHVLAFGVDRMEAVNMRFGFRAGDDILMLFAQHLAQRLNTGDALFRWRGPCFVVLTSRQGSESSLAVEARRILGPRLEHSVRMGEREIVMPVTASWTMLSLPPESCPDEALRKLDEFAIHRKQPPGETGRESRSLPSESVL